MLAASIFLAYANGANDNFKGVATLYGSGTLTYKQAIILATIATFIGSVCAIYFSQELVASFSGKGLVPQSVAGTSDFLVAVGFGAAATVLLATQVGLPISTTHSLIGGLLGAGIMSVGQEINIASLFKVFLIPLLVTPLIALILGFLVYQLIKLVRKTTKINKKTCICLRTATPLLSNDFEVLNNRFALIDQVNVGIITDNKERCEKLYPEAMHVVFMQNLVNLAHVLSAASVSFARGLNDAPKIAGILVAAEMLNLQLGMIAIASAMALGGWLSAHKVATTMSHKITEISHSQGLSANLVTSFLVIIASKLGVPVSTTHVSVGSIFGISMASGKRDAKVIRSILISWIFVLPVAMMFSALVYRCLS